MTPDAHHDALLMLGVLMLIFGPAILALVVVDAIWSRRTTPPHLAPVAPEPEAETPTDLIPCVTSARWPRSRAADDTAVLYVVRPTHDPDATQYISTQRGGHR